MQKDFLSYFYLLALNFSYPCTFCYPQVSFLISWFLVGFANSALVLQIGRCISGIGDGAIVPLIPVYISEIIDQDNRGVYIL
jgi:MFS family permease